MNWWRRAQELDILDEVVRETLIDTLPPITLEYLGRKRSLYIHRRAMGKFMEGLGVRMGTLTMTDAMTAVIHFTGEGAHVPMEQMNTIVTALKRLMGVHGVSVMNVSQPYALVYMEYPTRLED